MARPVHIHEPVDPMPFVEWFDALPPIEQVGRGDLFMVGNCERVGHAWGVNADTAGSRIRRWRTGETAEAERELVELAIDALSPDTTYSDVYGDDVRRCPSGRKKPSHAGVPYTIPEDVLIEAHRLHIDEGVSYRKLAVLFFDRCYSSSYRSLANSLHNAFKQREWETLSRAEAMARLNRAKHAHLPQCAHVFKAGAKKGEQCPRRTSTEFCWHHRPEQLSKNLAQLRAFEQSCP